MASGTRKNVIIQGLVGLIFLIMAVEMFLLLRQIRTLTDEIERLRHPRKETIEIGSSAPDFVLNNLLGEKVSLSDYEGMDLLLIFFSPECPACQVDIPNWKSLIALESDTLHVLGITEADSEETESFMSSYALDFEVVIDQEGGVKQIYMCESVPQKILIDQDGRVDYVEVGAVPRTETGQLERRLRGY